MQNMLKGCAAMVVSVLLAALFFVAGFMVSAYGPSSIAGTSYASRAEGLESIAEPPPNFNVFFEAMGVMRNEFYGELPDDSQTNYAAIRGVLAHLTDKNTILVEPVAHEREREQFQGEFGGIGTEIGIDEAGQIVIVTPIDDTPASRADLRANDIILEVDGKPLVGLEISEAAQLIRGEVGTEVTLLIQRPGKEESFSLTLTREKIPDPTVDSSLVEGSDIGYIRVGFFSARTTDEMRRALEELKAQGATKFILDLRNNPGGLLDAAIGTSSLFIGDGTIAYQQFNDGTRRTLEARGNPVAPDEPLLVLVNEGSASASEILAGALQSSDRAALVGTKSYGKGTVQIPYTLRDGSSLHVTIAHWLTPDGVDLSSEGLTPETIIETTEEQRQAGEDPVLDRAIEMLKEGAP